MTLPEGFKTISPWPWKYIEDYQYPPDEEEEDGGDRGIIVSRVTHDGWKDGRWDGYVCCNEPYYPTSVSKPDQKLIALSPDHALFASAVVRGVVVRYSLNKALGVRFGIKEAIGWSPTITASLDNFGCPILTDEVRAAIVQAMDR